MTFERKKIETVYKGKIHYTFNITLHLNFFQNNLLYAECRGTYLITLRFLLYVLNHLIIRMYCLEFWRIILPLYVILCILKLNEEMQSKINIIYT